MSSGMVADASRERVKRLGMTNKMLTKFYKGNGARWHSDSAYAREAFDYFMAVALTGFDKANRNVKDDALVLEGWQKNIYTKLGIELGTGYIDGARALSWLESDFSVWASRLPDDMLSVYGAHSIGIMLREGTTVPVGVPESSDMYADVEYVSNDIVLPRGSYDPRFLMAWGDDDIRILDFYRHGIIDRADIERFIADDVDAALALRTLGGSHV